MGSLFSRLKEEVFGFEPKEIVQIIADGADPFNHIDDAPLDSLIDRLENARIVLLGESTHGTSEFYRMRARITQELIKRLGFNIIGLEADWPDVQALNRHIRHLPHGLIEKKVFTRFPTWMWKNEEFHSLIQWLRHYNGSLENPKKHVNVYGLDLYGLFHSIEVVIDYLDQKNPQLAKLARDRYGCLLPWKEDPSAYAIAIKEWGIGCREEVLEMLQQLVERKLATSLQEDEEFFNAFQNAKSIVSSEEYYRTLYDSHVSSWNVRDKHMFDTLELLLSTKGKDAKAIVWAHNSHNGNAAATEMGEMGEWNIGELCKKQYGEEAYLIGFGTHKGAVAAASYWGGPMHIKELHASHKESYERLCHETHIPSFVLPLQEKSNSDVHHALLSPRLERAVGVIYIPENELRAHYFRAVLPEQFDEYIWFDHTSAVTPLSKEHPSRGVDTFPFGL